MTEEDYQQRIITGKPLFPIGQVIATSDVATSILEPNIIEMVRRHVSGDFGILGEDDCRVNHAAIDSGKGQIMSCYEVAGENVYVVTDHGRERTTVLFSYEY